MNAKYIIEIDLEPKNYGGSTKFFWCIIKENNGLSTNNGHGWADNVLTAFNKAYTYYKTHILKD